MKRLYRLTRQLLALDPEEKLPGPVKLVRKTWTDFFANEILTRASALAFTAMMAAIPFLALVITIAVYLLPDQTGPGSTGLGEQIISHLEVLLGTVFPAEAAVIFEEQIARLQAQPPVTVLSLSLVITLWLASNLFATVIDGLNRIYGVEESRPYWKLRLVAAFMTIVQSIILLLAVGAIFAWPIIVEAMGLAFKASWIATFVKWAVVFVMVLISFALTFFVGPDVTQRHRWVTPGSIFGAVVFLLATYGFRYYVQHLAQYDAMYGSLGGVMIVMFWFWINSLVLLLAAQLNKVFHYASQWSEAEVIALEPIAIPGSYVSPERNDSEIRVIVLDEIQEEVILAVSEDSAELKDDQKSAKDIEKSLQDGSSEKPVSKSRGETGIGNAVHSPEADCFSGETETSDKASCQSHPKRNPDSDSQAS